MAERANTTANGANNNGAVGAPPPAVNGLPPAVAPHGDDGGEAAGVLGRLRDARGAPLSPRTRRAKAVPVLRSLRWRYAQAAAPLLRTLRDTARALVALKADSHAAAGRYVGQAYLDRRFLFALDFGPGARTEQRQAEDPPAFAELAADAQALLDTTIEVADAPAPPQRPLENDAALWATVDAIETSEHHLTTAAAGAGAAGAIARIRALVVVVVADDIMASHDGATPFTSS